MRTKKYDWEFFFWLIFLQARFFKPTTLGEALIAGYNKVGLRQLALPQLRAKTEADMQGICNGQKTRVRQDFARFFIDKQKRNQ